MFMFTEYTFMHPLRTKTAFEVVQAYIDNLCSKFGGSSHILSDSDNVAEQLGVQYKIYSPLYHPQSNGRK